MTVEFLGKEIELKVLSLGQSDEVQFALLGNSNIAAGAKKASVNMRDFKKHQYLTIEYGTKDPEITEKYLKEKLTRKDEAEVQKLFEAIVEFNG